VRPAFIAAAVLAITLVAPSLSAAQPTNVRLSNDSPTATGYVSAYTLVTGNAYTDNVIAECNIARGRQNEPSVAVDPRNTQVILGSSNDYCGVTSWRAAAFRLSGRSGSATTARRTRAQAL
jgi:hypothetical protein